MKLGGSKIRLSGRKFGSYALLSMLSLKGNSKLLKIIINKISFEAKVNLRAVSRVKILLLRKEIPGEANLEELSESLER